MAEFNFNKATNELIISKNGVVAVTISGFMSSDEDLVQQKMTQRISLERFFIDIEGVVSFEEYSGFLDTLNA